MEGLVSVLGQERQAVERLVFRLLEVRAVLLAGQQRFLGWAAADLEAAAGVARTVGTRRWEVASLLLGSGGPPTLEALRACAAPPFDFLLTEQGRALELLSAEVVVSLEIDAELAVTGLAALHDEAGFEALSHRPAPAGAAADALDRAIGAAGYEAVLAALDAVALPGLATFLG